MVRWPLQQRRSIVAFLLLPLFVFSAVATPLVLAPVTAYADEDGENTGPESWEGRLLDDGLNHDKSAVLNEIVAASEGDFAKLTELLKDNVVVHFARTPSTDDGLIRGTKWVPRLGWMLSWVLKHAYEHRESQPAYADAFRRDIVTALARDRGNEAHPIFEATMAYLPREVWQWFLAQVGTALRGQVKEMSGAEKQARFDALWLLSQTRGVQRLHTLKVLTRVILGQEALGTNWDEEALLEALTQTLRAPLFRSLLEYKELVKSMDLVDRLDRVLKRRGTAQVDGVVEFTLELGGAVKRLRDRTALEDALRDIAALTPDGKPQAIAKFLDWRVQPAIRRAALLKARSMSPGLDPAWTDLLVGVIARTRDRPTTEALIQLLGANAFQPRTAEEQVQANTLASALVERLRSAAGIDDVELRVGLASALGVVGSREHILAALRTERGRWIERGGDNDAVYAQLIRSTGSLRGLPVGTLVLHAFRDTSEAGRPPPTTPMRRAVIDGLGTRLRDDPGTNGPVMEAVLRIFLTGGPRASLPPALDGPGDDEKVIALLPDPIEAFSEPVLRTRILNALQYASEADTVDLLGRLVAEGGAQGGERNEAAERALGALMRRAGDPNATKALLALVDPSRGDLAPDFVQAVLELLGGLPTSVAAGDGDADLRDEVQQKLRAFLGAGVAAEIQAAAAASTIRLRDTDGLDAFLGRWRAVQSAEGSPENPWGERLYGLLMAITEPVEGGSGEAANTAATWLRMRFSRAEDEAALAPFLDLVISLATRVADERKNDAFLQIAVDAQLAAAAGRPAGEAQEILKDALRRVDVLLGNISAPAERAVVQKTKYDLLILRAKGIPVSDAAARQKALLVALDFLVQELGTSAPERAKTALEEAALFPSLRDLFVEGGELTRQAYDARLNTLKSRLEAASAAAEGSNGG